MTRYFCRASGGSDSNDGLTYATAFATPNHFEAVSPLAGDELRFAPGTYRLSVSLVASGGNAYATGTVSCTRGSAVITGSGTAWLANAFASQGMFKVSQIAHGTDGVSNGTTTFTSAAGNFQASMIGMVIRINGKSPYTITAVASATSITLSGSPSAGSSLTYDVGGEPTLEILSVDSNTQITLKEAWAGPTVTGLAYTTWQDIRYIGDEDGQLTDGIGGRIRITGSDDDLTIARNSCLTNSAKSYRTFRNLYFGETSGTVIINTGDHIVIENCCVYRAPSGINNSGAGALHNSYRKNRIEQMTATGMIFTHTATVDNCGCVVENTLFLSIVSNAISCTRVGGIMVRNISSPGCRMAQVATASPATGQNGISIYNSLGSATATAFAALVTTDIFENYNGVDNYTTPRVNTNTGANSQIYPMLMDSPLLSLGIHNPIPGMLSPLSAYIALASFLPAITDLYGTIRPATPSWGCVQYEAGRRPSDSGYSAGRRMGAK